MSEARERNEQRYGVINSYEDAVWANPTDIQKGPVLTPSDISSTPPGAGPVTVRQMTPEERARYQPNRPTRQDLIDDLAAGLSGPEIAQKWAVPAERVYALIRYYGLRRTPAEAEARKQEQVDLRARIMAEMAGKERNAVKRVLNREIGQKLTREVLVQELRDLKPAEIAQKYDCGESTAWALMKKYMIKRSDLARGNAPESGGAQEQQAQVAPVQNTPKPATVEEIEPRKAPAPEEPISSGLNLSARGTYTADRLSRILAGIMAAVQEAGGEFGAYIEVRGRDASG